MHSFTLFAKERCILLCSSQKNIAFFLFFYVLCKRTLHSLHSFTFFRKERKRMHCSFGFHKLSKTQKGKRMLRSLKECNRMMHSERKRAPCPTLVKRCFVKKDKFKFKFVPIKCTGRPLKKIYSVNNELLMLMKKI